MITTLTATPKLSAWGILRMYLALFSVGAAVCSSNVMAQSAPDSGTYASDSSKGNDHEKQGRRRPPLEAVQACQQKKAGDTCSFTGRGGAAVQGTCGGTEGKPPACKPAGRAG
jgi:hypothetical protein